MEIEHYLKPNIDAILSEFAASVYARVRRCPECGKQFLQKRSDALRCSSKCGTLSRVHKFRGKQRAVHGNHNTSA